MTQPPFAPVTPRHLPWLFLLALSLITFSPRVVALPNVVFILVDDLGYGDTSLYGSSVVATPQIESIANNGVLFTQAYSACPECLPARASTLVSRYPERMGMINNSVGELHFADMPSDKTIASLLKTKGYKTCAIGKWHLGDTVGLRPGGRGFDQFFGFYGGRNSFYNKDAPPDAVHLDANGNVLIGGMIETMPGQSIIRNGNVVSETSHLTDAFTREALDYIDTNAGGAEPFFMYLAYNAPHNPYQCPKSYYDQHSGLSNPKKRIYAGMIDQLDDAIGEVLAKLTAKGIADNTIVIFASDNGAPHNANTPGVNAPLRGGKYNVYEGGVRIPLAIKWPDGYASGTVYSRPVSLLDVLPTVCVAAGFNQNVLVNSHGIDGVDLSPLIDAVLTEDDFNDGNTTGWTQYNGSWSVSGGQLIFSAGVSEGKLMINGTDLGDFSFETEIKLTSGAGGLVFGASSLAGGTNAYFGYRVVLKSGSSEIQINRVDKGSATTLATASFTVDPTKTYRLRVVVEGNKIQAYVDDMANPKVSATDSTYPNGRFGLCSTSSATAAVFDNVIITPHDSLCWNYETEGSSPELQASVRDGDFKYITFDDLNGNIAEELYNIVTDEDESTNLAGDSAYATVLQRLRDVFAKWESEN